MTNPRTTFWLALAIGWLVAATGDAAEIRLRSDVVCERAVVRLGDLAEIHAADPARAELLESLELFPAPAAGLPRVVHAREVQEILFVRGMNLAECRIMGASQVKISVPTRREPQAIKAVIPAMERRSLEAVRSALLAYLDRQSKSDEPVEIRFNLTEPQVRAIDAGAYRVRIGGGCSPWTGRQQFELNCGDTPATPLEVEVERQQTGSALVAVRSISRGAIIQEADVRLERLKPGTDDTGLCDRVELVVGRETTRTIAAGQWIDAEVLRQPVVVHRNDAVTVYSRSAGLRVRTTARACEDGSLGDVIPIESMLNRQKFLARVSGTQEVEIYARPADTNQSQPLAGTTSRAATN